MTKTMQESILLLLGVVLAVAYATLRSIGKLTPHVAFAGIHHSDTGSAPFIHLTNYGKTDDHTRHRHRSDHRARLHSMTDSDSTTMNVTGAAHFHDPAGDTTQIHDHPGHRIIDRGHHDRHGSTSQVITAGAA